MKKWILIAAALVALAGCGGEGFQVSPVIEGQVAPHDGWLVTDLYLEKGDEVKMTGFVLYIEGVDPNSIMDELQ